MVSCKQFSVIVHYIIAVVEFWHKSIFCEFRIVVVSDQGRPAASIGTFRLFVGYLENAKYQPNEKLHILFKT